MTINIKTKIAAAMFVLAAGSANAMTIVPLGLGQDNATASVPLVKVHSLHTSCMYGSVTPSGTGSPKAWHKTPEAGVHINCAPPRTPGGGKLTIKPGSSNSSGNRLSN
jgi:hypothetical protein